MGEGECRVAVRKGQKEKGGAKEEEERKEIGGGVGESWERDRRELGRKKGERGERGKREKGHKGREERKEETKERKEREGGREKGIVEQN